MNSFLRLLFSVWMQPGLGKFAFQAGVCYTFKTELMTGTHDFIGDAIKIALYTQAGGTDKWRGRQSMTRAVAAVGAGGRVAHGALPLGALRRNLRQRLAVARDRGKVGVAGSLHWFAGHARIIRQSQRERGQSRRGVLFKLTQ